MNIHKRVQQSKFYKLDRSARGVNYCFHVKRPVLYIWKPFFRGGESQIKWKPLNFIKNNNVISCLTWSNWLRLDKSHLTTNAKRKILYLTMIFAFCYVSDIVSLYQKWSSKKSLANTKWRKTKISSLFQQSIAKVQPLIKCHFKFLI